MNYGLLLLIDSETQEEKLEEMEKDEDRIETITLDPLKIKSLLQRYILIH